MNLSLILVSATFKCTTFSDFSSPYSKKCMMESEMCTKVLYTAQNVRLRVGCAKIALYSTKCTPESEMCKKCSIQHKMYVGEWDVQKVLYTAQNVPMHLSTSELIHVHACALLKVTII